MLYDYDEWRKKNKMKWKKDERFFSRFVSFKFIKRTQFVWNEAKYTHKRMLIISAAWRRNSARFRTDKMLFKRIQESTHTYIHRSQIRTANVVLATSTDFRADTSRHVKLCPFCVQDELIKTHFHLALLHKLKTCSIKLTFPSHNVNLAQYERS